MFLRVNRTVEYRSKSPNVVARTAKSDQNLLMFTLSCSQSQNVRGGGLESNLVHSSNPLTLSLRYHKYEKFFDIGIQTHNVR